MDDILGSNEEKRQFPWEYYRLRSDKFDREVIADVIEAAMNEKFDIGHIADRVCQHIEG